VNQIAKEKIPIRAGLIRVDANGRLILLGTHCPRCGKTFFPKKSICPSCFVDEPLEVVELQGKGKVYSFTIIHQGPKGFKTPYATLYVDMPEGVRIFGPGFLEDFPKGFEIGMEVKVESTTLDVNGEGIPIMGFKFIPKE